MNVANDEKYSYYIGGIMSLHKIQIDFENDCISKREDVSYLELTGCGIDINDQGLVASGDFSGNVYLWKPGERSPYGRFKAASSIRCMKWIGDYLVFGCLNSIVYCWKHVGNSVTHTTDANNSIRTLYNVFGDPVAMALNRLKNKIALGTTTGYLYVFSINYTDGQLVLEELYNIQIHEPKKLDDGSLLMMEIWNVAWSVTDQYIATTSEDQTCKISESRTGKILKSFFFFCSGALQSNRIRYSFHFYFIFLL